MVLEYRLFHVARSLRAIMATAEGQVPSVKMTDLLLPHPVWIKPVIFLRNKVIDKFRQLR